MKKRFIRLLFLTLAIIIVGYLGGIKVVNENSTVRAFGELLVDFHVPPLAPIFVVNDMAPGDFETRPVDVHNGGVVGRMVSVQGVRTGGVGVDPKLETVLDLTIRDGATPIYGSGSATGVKTLLDFFSESASPSGVVLNIISAGADKTYHFDVTFPNSAGNDFQAKSVIFDLVFGIVTSDSLVINEVYYPVDSTHGLDSPKDRGILAVNGNSATINISGNGVGSTNIVTVNIKDVCKVVQRNYINSIISIFGRASSGGNNANGNTEGLTNINTGSSSAVINIINAGSTNSFSGCGKKLGQNDEWVELYNPTDQEVSLKNWSLMDVSGGTTKINANKKIKAGGFAILSKSASTWTLWSEDPLATKVELGGNIGDGLDNAGDLLILKDPGGTEIDRMSWGTDASGFTPPAVLPVAATGSSAARFVPGLDTDTVSDWHEQIPPSPGN